MNAALPQRAASTASSLVDELVADALSDDGGAGMADLVAMLHDSAADAERDACVDALVRLAEYGVSTRAAVAIAIGHADLELDALLETLDGLRGSFEESEPSLESSPYADGEQRLEELEEQELEATLSSFSSPVRWRSPTKSTTPMMSPTSFSSPVPRRSPTKSTPTMSPTRFLAMPHAYTGAATHISPPAALPPAPPPVQAPSAQEELPTASEVLASWRQEVRANDDRREFTQSAVAEGRAMLREKLVRPPPPAKEQFEELLLGDVFVDKLLDLTPSIRATIEAGWITASVRSELADPEDSQRRPPTWPPTPQTYFCGGRAVKVAEQTLPAVVFDCYADRAGGLRLRFTSRQAGTATVLVHVLGLIGQNVEVIDARRYSFKVVGRFVIKHVAVRNARANS